MEMLTNRFQTSYTEIALCFGAKNYLRADPAEIRSYSSLGTLVEPVAQIYKAHAR